jgi:hypothetical protein
MREKCTLTPSGTIFGYQFSTTVLTLGTMTRAGPPPSSRSSRRCGRAESLHEADQMRPLFPRRDRSRTPAQQ